MVGVSSSVIPYVCDQLAMSRLPRATYALFVALLPATAAIVGTVVLRQLLTTAELAGVALVMAGVALHRQRQAAGDDSGSGHVRPPATAIDQAARRQLAVDLFNHVWTLLDTDARTPAQDVEMIHAAHASRHHWGEVGTPVNVARGEWQISRVYATLGRGEPALFHAQRCLDACTEHGIGDFDLAYAHEAMARAYRVLGDGERTAAHAAAAAEAGEAIAEEDDRRAVRGRPRRPAIARAPRPPRPVVSAV